MSNLQVLFDKFCLKFLCVNFQLFECKQTFIFLRKKITAGKIRGTTPISKSPCTGPYKTLKDYTCSNYLTYRMLARPNRPTREWHQVPGVTSTKII